MKGNHYLLQLACSLFRTRAVFAGFLGLLLILPQTVLADDESSALANFNRAVQAANPQLAQATYERDHANPPTKQEIDKIAATLINAAIDVMDQAGELKKRFPQSKNLAGVRDSLIGTLASVFGSAGLPVPKDRAADLEACTRNLMHETPSDLHLYMILCRVAAGLPAAQERAIYEELSHESTPKPARDMAQGALRKLERIGMPMDFSFTAVDGRHVSLAELKGKVVVVDFWATDCVPCVRDLPDLKQLYTKYSAKGFEIVGISLDTDKEVLTRFIEKEKIPWPQDYAPKSSTNHLAQTYGIGTIPSVWLVDRKGILREMSSGEDLEKKIGALLKE